MVLRCYEENRPDFVDEPQFRDRLEQLGVHFAVEEDAARWHDFTDVDVALCVRRPHEGRDDTEFLRKPATKMINAWAARTIPLVAPERGYLELARVGTDALLVRTPDDIIESLRYLKARPEAATAMFARAGIRGREFSVDTVLRRWQQLLEWPHPPVRPLDRTWVATSALASWPVEKLSHRARRHRRPRTP
jgi:hypothetical protein